MTQGSHIWSIPTKADVKSMIWYPIKAFAAKGYTVPKTWDDLVALSDKIVAAGSHPFCVSAGGPGTATGWELTDWIEEVVLKTQALAGYNDWISHKITFEDPRIKAAFDKVGSLLFKQGYVDGGGAGHREHGLRRPRWIRCSTSDTATPGCWMQKIPTLVRPGLLPGPASERREGRLEVRDRRYGHRALRRSRLSTGPTRMSRARLTR